jgi:preprotein translocase subunit Sec61beta
LKKRDSCEHKREGCVTSANLLQFFATKSRGRIRPSENLLLLQQIPIAILLKFRAILWPAEP